MSSPVSTATADRMLDRVVIWRACKAHPGMSGRQLAQLLHKPETTVRRALKLQQATPKEMLQAFESEAVDAWQAAIPVAARKGDHRPAKDLLLHVRAIEPVDSAARTSIALVIAGIDLPGLGLLSPNQGAATLEIPNVIDAKVSSVTNA